MATTTRWALPYPQLDGLVAADVPFWMNALAVALDDHAKDDQGTLANRPVSTVGTPGKKGRYYMVKGDSTAANNGILWRDNGTGWDQVGASTIFDTRANRPAANAVPAGQRFFATDQISEWLSDGSSWFRLGPAAVGDIIWTNEASARTGYILLQGQAWPGTTGIYADLNALWGGANLPDLRARMPVALGTHADVDALLENEGVATVGNRRPKHRTTDAKTVAVGSLAVNPASHRHRWLTSPGGGSEGSFGLGAGSSHSYSDIMSGPSTGDLPGVENTALAISGAPSLGGSIGTNVGTDPLDAPAYIVLQPQAKL